MKYCVITSHLLIVRVKSLRKVWHKCHKLMIQCVYVCVSLFITNLYSDSQESLLTIRYISLWLELRFKLYSVWIVPSMAGVGFRRFKNDSQSLSCIRSSRVWSENLNHSNDLKALALMRWCVYARSSEHSCVAMVWDEYRVLGSIPAFCLRKYFLEVKRIMATRTDSMHSTFLCTQ